MSVKITTLELYDFKKVRAFQCEPAAVGLTVIGGKSRAGKTSIPSCKPKRERGAVTFYEKETR